MRKLKTSLPLFLVIGTFLFLRLATLSKLMVFTPDEEYILYITTTLVRHIHIIWIGVSALGFDFYMGPFLNYFLIPFIYLSKGDPIIWGVITSIAGVATCYLIYFLGNKIFNKKVGFLAAIIYGFSALLIYYDQQPYPSGVTLLSMILLISIYMTKFSKKWWILFSFFYGIVFHIHLSLVLVLFVAIFWAATHKKTWDFKILLASVAVFILAISPLIGFDYFHKLSNVTAPIRVIEAMGKTKSKFNLQNRFLTLTKTMSRIFVLDIGKSNSDEILYPCNTLPGNDATKVKWPIAVAVLILIAVFFLKKNFWNDEGMRLLVIFSLSFLIPFIFLSSIGSVEYYLLGFFPVLILILAYAIRSLPFKFRLTSYMILLVFIIYNTVTVFSANESYGLNIKRSVINDVMKIIGKSSYELIESGGPCQGNAGWGYLFTVYGRSPDKNTADRQFNWLLPIGNVNKTRYKIVINETRSRTNISGYKSKFVEGGFTIYIFEK